MRFRAKLSREKFPLFWRHIHTLDKTCKEVIMLLSPTELCLVVVAPGEAMMQYTHIDVSGSNSGALSSPPSSPPPSSSSSSPLFEEFRVEHKRNLIPLSFTIDNLLHGLTPPEPAVDLVVLKLVKRGVSPYMTIESRSPHAGVIMTHDIPVKLLQPELAERYTAPRLPLPHVRMLFPDPARAAAVLERMRSLSKYVTIVGDMGWKQQQNRHHQGNEGTNTNASLTFSVRNESVHMQTFFRHLVSEDYVGTAVSNNSSTSSQVSQGDTRGSGNSSSSTAATATSSSSTSASTSTSAPNNTNNSGSAFSPGSSGRAAACVSARDLLRVLRSILAFSAATSSHSTFNNMNGMDMNPNTPTPLEDDVGLRLRDSWLFGIIQSRVVFLHLQLDDGGKSSITYLHSVVDAGVGGGDDNDEVRGGGGGGGGRGGENNNDI